MADVSYLQFFHLQPNSQYQRHSNSIANFTMVNNNNLSSSHSHYSHLESDYLDSVTGPNCFYGEDQMNFVTNLFESCEEYDPNAIPDPFLGTLNNEDFCLNHVEELGLGFGDEFDRVNFDTQSTEHCNSNNCGLRVVGIDSDSDAEEIDDVSRVDENGTIPNGNSGLPILGNCVLFDDQMAGVEEFNWEEVDEREGLSSVIDRIEEISVSSGTCSLDEDDIVEESERDLEWEVLLAVNNLDRNRNLGNVSDGISYVDVEDEYTYDAEYDSPFGQFVESASSVKISPPAAKYVVENLPSVVLTKEDLEENNVVCAVCADEIVVEEKVTRLPCRHHYHGECIVPWLRTRNTCPVCRFELPTDNEWMKIGEGDLALLDDLQVRYHFELSPSDST